MCVDYMSPVERKKVEDVAREAGIQEDEIPSIVELKMKFTLAHDGRDVINYYLVKNFVYS